MDDCPIKVGAGVLSSVRVVMLPELRWQVGEACMATAPGGSRLPTYMCYIVLVGPVLRLRGRRRKAATGRAQQPAEAGVSAVPGAAGSARGSVMLRKVPDSANPGIVRKPDSARKAELASSPDPIERPNAVIPPSTSDMSPFSVTCRVMEPSSPLSPEAPCFAARRLLCGPRGSRMVSLAARASNGDTSAAPMKLSLRPGIRILPHTDTASESEADTRGSPPLRPN